MKDVVRERRSMASKKARMPVLDERSRAEGEKSLYGAIHRELQGFLNILGEIGWDDVKVAKLVESISNKAVDSIMEEIDSVDASDLLPQRSSSRKTSAPHPMSDTFVRSYVETALWSSMDESDESGGQPLDENYTADDLAPETLKQMNLDCINFEDEAAELLDKAEELGVRNVRDRAGHDFWLTRNGHGAGFWDGDWPDEIEDELTKLANSFGSYDLYVGDDGLIYGT